MPAPLWSAPGPTPVSHSAADYDATVADLVTSGIMIDDAMVYWYARPSVTYPTVEVRAEAAKLTAERGIHR